MMVQMTPNVAQVVRTQAMQREMQRENKRMHSVSNPFQRRWQTRKRPEMAGLISQISGVQILRSKRDAFQLESCT